MTPMGSDLSVLSVESVGLEKSARPGLPLSNDFSRLSSSRYFDLTELFLAAGKAFSPPSTKTISKKEDEEIESRALPVVRCPGRSSLWGRRQYRGSRKKRRSRTDANLPHEAHRAFQQEGPLEFLHSPRRPQIQGSQPGLASRRKPPAGGMRSSCTCAEVTMVKVIVIK
jgi:hypothetical protein